MPRPFTRTETDGETGEESERDIPFMKGYTVFNVEQIDGLPAHFYAHRQRRSSTPCSASSTPSGSLPRPARPSGMAAIRPFTPSRPTTCRCRSFETFRDAESYYATLAHETTHWTRHPSRLDRSFGRKRFGDEGYAMEELVAELGAAFLSADLGLTPEPREDHAAYIGHWLNVLKNDKRAIFTAASHAQRAADFLCGFSAASQREAA